MLELVLFENEAEGARRHLDAGISTFMIDMEQEGKDLRQLGFDTEIRPGTFDDLQAMADLTGATCWCRLNRLGEGTQGEIEGAIDAGADLMVLPMANSASEVERFLKLLDGRCRAGVMVETLDGAAMSPALDDLPVDYVCFGLNDFAISRGGGNIFRALVDGSVEEVRNALPHTHFGVGGLTDMRLGAPLPSFRILQEIERLSCRFSFLRRAFRRDSQKIPPAEIVAGINEHWQRYRERSEEQRLADREAFVQAIGALSD